MPYVGEALLCGSPLALSSFGWQLTPLPCNDAWFSVAGGCSTSTTELYTGPFYTVPLHTHFARYFLCSRGFLSHLTVSTTRPHTYVTSLPIEPSSRPSHEAPSLSSIKIECYTSRFSLAV